MCSAAAARIRCSWSSAAASGGTAVGDVLRDLLLDRRQTLSLPCEALLFMASRAQLVAEVIRPALVAGQWVISDRFSDSTRVYQVEVGGLPVESVALLLKLQATDAAA